MTVIKYLNNELFIEDKKINFKYNIQQLKQDETNVYILLDIPQKNSYDYNDFHNVYAYSKNGNKLWQIGSRQVGDNDIYTLINLLENEFYATDFSGRRYRVNKETGEPNRMQVVK